MAVKKLGKKGARAPYLHTTERFWLILISNNSYSLQNQARSKMNL